MEALTATYYATPYIEDGYYRFNDQVGEVTQCGAGFLLIKRHVFTTLERAYPGLRHTDRREQSPAGGSYSDHFYYHFEVAPDPETGRYLSEDYYFIKRWRDIGGKVYADYNVSLSHFGPHAFVGRPSVHYVNQELLLEASKRPQDPSGIRVEAGDREEGRGGAATPSPLSVTQQHNVVAPTENASSELRITLRSDDI